MGAFVNGKWLRGDSRELAFTGPEDEEYEIEFRVTSWGSGPSWTHPGDPVEWEWDKVVWHKQDGTTEDVSEESLKKLGIDPDDVIMKKWTPDPGNYDYPDD